MVTQRLITLDCTPVASSLVRIITEDSHTNSTQLRIHLQRDTDKCIPRTFEGVRHNTTLGTDLKIVRHWNPLIEGH